MGSRKGRCAGRPGRGTGEGWHGWATRAKTTPSRCTGVVAAACTQGKRTQHGKPLCVIRDDQTGRPRGTGRARWGGGEARSTAEAGECRWRGGASVQDKRNKRRGTGRLGNLTTPKRVQKLQMALPAKAKAEAGYRFYALDDKISREDILAHAYAQCRSNQGAPGVDGQDFADIEAYGVERWLAELALALRKETYRPEPI